MVTDDEIKRVAIRICEELGLDPWQKIMVGDGATQTPNELNGRTAFFDMAWEAELWETWRKQAAIQIAAHRAMD